MICAQCNTSNNYYYIFCHRCGNRLPLADAKVSLVDKTAPYSAIPKIVLCIEPNRKNKRTIAVNNMLQYIGIAMLGVTFSFHVRNDTVRWIKSLPRPPSAP